MKRIATTCDGRHAQLHSPKGCQQMFRVALRCVSLSILQAIRLGLDEKGRSHGDGRGPTRKKSRALIYKARADKEHKTKVKHDRLTHSASSLLRVFHTAPQGQFSWTFGRRKWGFYSPPTPAHGLDFPFLTSRGQLDNAPADLSLQGRWFIS